MDSYDRHLVSLETRNPPSALNFDAITADECRIWVREILTMILCTGY